MREVINPILFQFTMLIYLVSSISYFLYIGTKKDTFGKVGGWVALLGFTLNMTAMVIRYLESDQLGVGYVPLSNMYESMVFFSSAIVGFHLLFEKMYQTRTLGAMIMPLGFFTMRRCGVRHKYYSV